MKYSFLIVLLVNFICVTYAIGQKEEYIKYKDNLIIKDSLNLNSPEDSVIIEGKVYEICGDTSTSVGKIRIKELKKECLTDINGSFKMKTIPGTYTIILMDKASSFNGEDKWENVLQTKLKALPQHIKKVFFYRGCSMVVDKIHK